MIAMDFGTLNPPPLTKRRYTSHCVKLYNIQNPKFIELSKIWFLSESLLLLREMSMSTYNII